VFASGLNPRSGCKLQFRIRAEVQRPTDSSMCESTEPQWFWISTPARAARSAAAPPSPRHAVSSCGVGLTMTACRQTPIVTELSVTCMHVNGCVTTFSALRRTDYKTVGL